MSGLAAVFLDRDGTIIHDPGYIGDPAAVELLRGAGEAIARLNSARLPVIVVTNQSGIGRGMYGEPEFHAVQQRMEELLAGYGGHIDAVYHCPHAPDVEPPCECRKPLPGMFLRAAAEHDLDLSASYFIGDRPRDVEPALKWGGKAILVGPPGADQDPPDVARVPSLQEAVDDVLAERKR